MKAILAVTAASLIALQSFALPILSPIGPDRLLGTVTPGTPADPGNELTMANGLFLGWVDTPGYAYGSPSGYVMGDNPADPNYETYVLMFSPYTVIPRDAPIPSGVLESSTGLYLSLPLGAEWLVAKWGRDAAVYYVGGMSGTVFLTTEGTGWSAQGHGLSGWTILSGPRDRRIPDGGTTALMLGGALLAFAILLSLKRRRG